MAYLILQILALGLIAGLYFLTRHETARGARFFAAHRSALDHHVSRSRFLFENVDWKGFCKEHGKRFAERLGHDVAHATLQSVRSLEHLLTEFVRKLRSAGTHSQHAHASPREASRPFVKALSDFKSHLQAKRPESPEM